MKKHLKSLLVLILLIPVTGCVSVYNAAVFGHDLLDIPTPARSETMSLKLAAAAKIYAAVGVGSPDSSVAGLGGGFASWQLPTSTENRLQLAAGFSGFVSQTLVRAYDYSRSYSSIQVDRYLGYGFTYQLQAAHLTDLPAGGWLSLGLAGGYTKESGAYANWRQGLPAVASSVENWASLGSINKFDGSRSATTTVVEGLWEWGVPLSADLFGIFKAGLGVGFSDWPDLQSRSLVESLSAGLRYGPTTWRLFWELLNPFNVSIGLSTAIEFN